MSTSFAVVIEQAGTNLSAYLTALLSRLPQGSKHVEIAGGSVHPINPIKAKIKLLTEGAVAPRATALGNAEGLRRIDRALEELEIVEDIQIADDRLADNHPHSPDQAIVESAELTIVILDASAEYYYSK